MTVCPRASPVRCEVDPEARWQMVAVPMFALLLWMPQDFGALVRACCALRGCRSDLTLCEVGIG